MLELFQARAAAVSAEVHRFPDLAGALGFLRAFLDEQGGTAVFAPGPALEAAGWATPPVTRETAAAARVGISQMDWAIADTGTLVQDATAVAKRLVSTLPPAHVALVAADRLVPDLAAALERMEPLRSGYLSLITGPSRTADIERVLTIGVHGPARLLILIVEGIPS